MVSARLCGLYAREGAAAAGLEAGRRIVVVVREQRALARFRRSQGWRATAAASSRSPMHLLYPAMTP